MLRSFISLSLLLFVAPVNAASDASLDVDAPTPDAVLEAAPPPPICPVTADPRSLPDLGSGAVIAGNGSGFLLLSSNLAQPLDAEGRPAAEARARYGFNPIDLDWAGDRYMASSGNFIAGFSPDGEEVMAPVPLPVSGANAAWSGSRGVIIGYLSGQTTPYALFALPARTDGSLGEPLFLGDTSASPSFAVEPFGDGFLAVYVLDQMNLVVALRFDADGKPVGEVEQIAAATDASDVRIAVHPAGAIVTFESYLHLLTAVPIRPDGTPGPVGFSVDRVQAYALAPTPGGALLYVNRGRGEPREDRLYTLDAEAHAVGERTGERMVEGLLVRRAEGLLLFTRGSETRITPLDFDGVAVAPPHAAVLAPADQSNVHIASDGVRFVSAWITRTANGDRIEASTMDARGENPSCAVVAEGRIESMALAGSPAGFLIVWNERYQFHASFLSGDSWIELPLDLMTSGAVLAADLAWDGAAFRLAWEDHTFITPWPTASEVRTVRITPAGAVSEWRATPVAEDPHVAAIGDLTLLAVRTNRGSREMDLPPRVGASLIVYTGSETARIHELLPVRHWTAFGELAVPPFDIASNGTGAMAVVSDGHTLETIAIDAAGTPGARRELARGSKIAAASVASAGDGYVVSWVARDDRPRWGSYTVRWLVFTAEVDSEGRLRAPLRFVPAGWRNPFRPGDFDLAATPLDATAIWAPRFGGDAISIQLAAWRATAAPRSTADLHEGAAPPPSSVSIRRFESPGVPPNYPRTVELSWTPVAGADAYVIQATYLDPGRWETFEVVPGQQFQWTWTPALQSIAFRNPTHFRIASLTNGLASEWVEVSIRGRLVRR